MDDEQELTPEQEDEKEQAYREWKRLKHLKNYSSIANIDVLLAKNPLAEFKENE